MNTSSSALSFDPNIHAELVYDGGETIHVPERLGSPNADQLQGTPLERLAELAGRVCYDSLGASKARGSAAYHAHIREVGHLSVYEHCVRTVVIPTERHLVRDRLLVSCNRPGVFVTYYDDALRLTLNLRAVLEWCAAESNDPVSQTVLRSCLLEAVFQEAPVALAEEKWAGGQAALRHPVTDDEKWITLLMCGSRGMSHELVRHGDFTAISQRSTRYVDESESPWVEHPLLTRFRGGLPLSLDRVRGTVDDWIPLREAAALVYRGVVRVLEQTSPRKQARGAARGFLGNALYTEVIFSASVRQWRHMLRMRCSDAADAEIRVLFAKALQELKRSRYGDRFADLTLRPAADGIGEVLT